LITMLLGMAGAGLGGWLGRSFGFYGPGEPAGFLMALVGAVLLLLMLPDVCWPANGIVPVRWRQGRPSWGSPDALRKETNPTTPSGTWPEGLSEPRASARAF